MKPELKQVEATDEALMRCVAARDEAAFAKLYDRYAAICLGFMLRILHNRAEAEDVLQEVYLQIWQQASNYDIARGRAITWILTIARSRALDRLRKIDVRDRTVTAVTHEQSFRVATTTAIDDCLNLENAEIVHAALDGISEKQRQALILAYYEGLTQTQIAERLGEPLGTIKTRMRNGLLKLHGLLAAKPGNEIN